uniref:Uncharacterized protein n=1 Tax=Arundo donax TaxID=35708 RepID=A0A0A8ZCJ3_ARUDO
MKIKTLREKKSRQMRVTKENVQIGLISTNT